MLNYEEKILKGGYNRIVRSAENILLRPNDSKLFLGEEKFNAKKETLEKILENYKDDKIYRYYYEFSKEKYGFCNFERWLKLYCI